MTTLDRINLNCRQGFLPLKTLTSAFIKFECLGEASLCMGNEDKFCWFFLVKCEKFVVKYRVRHRATPIIEHWEQIIIQFKLNKIA